MLKVILSHAHESNVQTMQYGRVACDGAICVSYKNVAVVSHLREIRGRLKSESTVYPYELSGQTPQLFVGTGWGPDQLKQSFGICV